MYTGFSRSLSMQAEDDELVAASRFHRRWRRRGLSSALLGRGCASEARARLGEPGARRGRACALLSKGGGERVRARGEWGACWELAGAGASWRDDEQGWSRSRWGRRGAERAGRPAWTGVAWACALDGAGPGARLSETWRRAAGCRAGNRTRGELVELLGQVRWRAGRGGAGNWRWSGWGGAGGRAQFGNCEGS
jgi:hypothetical protein